MDKLNFSRGLNTKVNKYHPFWQIFRVNVKGTGAAFENKLLLARDFLKKNKSYENWYRVVNWLEGLALGYKNSRPENMLAIHDEITNYYMPLKDKYPKEQQLSNSEIEKKISELTQKERKDLWIDLFKRNRQWLSQGYNQPAINKFMTSLLKVLEKKNEINTINKTQYNIDELIKYLDYAQNNKGLNPNAYTRTNSNKLNKI